MLLLLLRLLWLPLCGGVSAAARMPLHRAQLPPQTATASEQ